MRGTSLARTPLASAALAAAALTLLAASLFADPAKSVPQLKADADSAVAAAIAAAGDYGANWAAAKACRLYGDEMVTQEYAGWKDLAKAAVRDGMKFGELATKLNPGGVEGWYWYGLCVGTYSDCVSILTALSEGLKGKTQKSFEMSYSINKMYDAGGPILALGRFWQVLPGIAGRDYKKAEQLFNEYLTLFGSGNDPNKDAWYYRGSLYKDTGRADLAKADIQKAASMGQKDAIKLLATLK
jgi:tetratricopeptide (TPR) repeat protein